jgi:hypothetical protein
MINLPQEITYEQVAYMQRIKDHEGAEYYTLGEVTNKGIENTLAVTPVGGDGRTLFYCREHKIAYGNRETCLGCRMQLVTEPIG